jgi:hypothetical protein
MKAHVVVVLALCALALVGCVGEEEDARGSDEPADYEPVTADGKADGVPMTFNQHDVVGDDLFLDDGEFTVTEIQSFLERSPYNNRSWLADHTVNGVSAAQAIFNAASSEGIHPMMILARMQVEASLVSKTTRPSTTRINAALGCGCPDGGGCAAQYRGFDKQLLCGAKILRKWYDASVDGSGQWRVGRSTRTLDPRTITPVNHATASLYQYTPWVLVGRGGNWLVWNVTKKYVRHAVDEGYIPAPN